LFLNKSVMFLLEELYSTNQHTAQLHRL
jgi:hypothetical protein